MYIKRWFKFSGNEKYMSNINIKEYSKHIKKIYDKFQNDKIPVDIIRLCESYKQKPLFAKKDDDFPFSCIVTSEMIKNAEKDKYEYCFIITGNDPVQQRLKIAMFFSALYMTFNNLCDRKEFKDNVIIRDSINTDSSVYKFAIMLLCPKLKLEKLIRDLGYTPSSLLNSMQYQKFVESFLISPLDFEYRLKLLVYEEV